jgi:hypothetical protein
VQAADDPPQLVIVPGDAVLGLGWLRRELCLSLNHSAEAKERTHDEDAHLYGAFALEDRCGHYRSVFGEAKRLVFRVITLLQGHGL